MNIIMTTRLMFRGSQSPVGAICMFLLAVGLIAGSGVEAYGSDEVPCHTGERPADVSKRLLTDATELAHPAVELSLPSSRQSVVVLSRLRNDVNTNYQGWVLIRTEGPVCSYRKFALPAMIEPPGLFDIEVEAVFVAAVGPERQRELVVLYRYHRNGAEQDNGYGSYIYRWDGAGFVSQPILADQVAGMRTAAAIRTKLGSSK